MVTALLRVSTFVVLAFSLGACGGGRNRVAAENAAILAARTGGVAAGFAPALYPPEVGAGPCDDGPHGGGPDDTVLHNCSTAVTLHDHGSATVRFTETISKGKHEWVFHVARDGHVSLVLSTGLPVGDLF